jgi:hypothetical protein
MYSYVCIIVCVWCVVCVCVCVCVCVYVFALVWVWGGRCVCKFMLGLVRPGSPPFVAAAGIPGTDGGRHCAGLRSHL